MFFTNYQGWELEGAKKTKMKCMNCNNTTDHYVYVVPYGLQVGLIFLKKPLIGMKKYYLTCSICGFLEKEISKEQAISMKNWSEPHRLDTKNL